MELTGLAAKPALFVLRVVRFSTMIRGVLAIAYVVPLLPTERRSIDEIRLEYNSGSVRLTVLGFTRDL